MSVGENVSRMRVEKGMTQSELADAVGVTRSMIAQIERNSKTPSIILSAHIAKALDAEISDMLR